MVAATKSKPKKPVKVINDLKKLPKALGMKLVKPEKPGAAKKAKPAASDSDILAEARTLAVKIRGKRHEEEGLKGELKELRESITSLTDEQSRLLLDSANGQGRLPFTPPSTSAGGAKPGATKTDNAAASSAVAKELNKPGAIETTLDGKTLRIIPSGEEFDAVILEGSNLADTVGTYAGLANAKKALLDEINWHGNAPEWKPVGGSMPIAGLL